MSDFGIRTVKTVLNEDQRWIGAQSLANGDVHGALGVTLDMTKFSRVTFADNLVPSGVALAKITASGLYAPYADATEVATPGTGVMAVFLLATIEWPADFPTSGNSSRMPVAVLHEGVIVESFLPTGHGVDANGKADVGKRFLFV